MEHPVCAEWLLDLRALGMHPAIAILERTETVHAVAGRESEIISECENTIVPSGVS